MVVVSGWWWLVVVVVVVVPWRLLPRHADAPWLVVVVVVVVVGARWCQMVPDGAR